MNSSLSDDELLALLRAGDESAFLTLYRRRQGGIYRFALRMAGSESIAEDITQEVFMTLASGESGYDSSLGSISAYLFGVARKQVLRRLEKEKRLSTIVDEDESPTPESLITMNDPLNDLTRKETIASVRQAVLGLPAHYREVVVLCDLHEMSYSEAADALGCPVGTVRSRLSRARAMLLERLRAYTSESAQTAGTANCLYSL